MESRRAVDAVAIEQRERRIAERGGAIDERFGQRRAVEKRKRGRGVEFDVHVTVNRRRLIEDAVQEPSNRASRSWNNRHRRIATSDVVYLPRQVISNLLAYFDRGKFVRRPDEYLELIRKAGLRIMHTQIVRSHPENGRALYLMTALQPGS